eukprot:scaffold246_cov414-Prasinococcus_capsulatus_cf.AAC.6
MEYSSKSSEVLLTCQDCHQSTGLPCRPVALVYLLPVRHAYCVSAAWAVVQLWHRPLRPPEFALTKSVT